MLSRSMILAIVILLLVGISACSGEDQSPTTPTLPREKPAPTASAAETPQIESGVETDPIGENGTTIEFVQDIKWLWTEIITNDPAGQSNVRRPDQYTVTFLANGSAIVDDPCNQVIWAYMMDGSLLRFENPDPGMYAFCGQDDLGQEYLPALGQVASWNLEGDFLTLELEANAGSLGFIDSRAAGE